MRSFAIDEPGSSVRALYATLSEGSLPLPTLFSFWLFLGETSLDMSDNVTSCCVHVLVLYVHSFVVVVVVDDDDDVSPSISCLGIVVVGPSAHWRSLGSSATSLKVTLTTQPN